MADCHKCKYEVSAECVPRSQKIGFPNCFQNTITHYDSLRAMSDEELAEYLAPCACPPKRFSKDTGDIVCPVNKEPSRADCKQCWLGWLREEATI